MKFLKSLNPAEVKSRGWLPALDGLRTIAVMFVLIGHTLPVGHFALANGGVALFFALSGFLAYYVLHQDEQRLGRVDYNYFLQRRILRIWPAYFTIIALSFLIESKDAITNAAIAPLFTFTVNWDMAAFRAWPLAPHTWTIAAEQQFYLLAPFIYRLLRSRYALIFCAAVFIISNIACVLHMMLAPPTQSGNGGLYYTTYAYIDTFIAGAVAAHLYLKGWRLNAWQQWVQFLISSGLFIFTLYLWYDCIFPPYINYSLIPFVLLPIALGPLVFSVLPMQRPVMFNRILASPPMVAIALLSYSLYLVHMFVIDHVSMQPWIYFPVCLAAAIVLHFIIERPFMRGRHHLQRWAEKFSWPVILTWGLIAIGAIRFIGRFILRS